MPAMDDLAGKDIVGGGDDRGVGGNGQCPDLELAAARRDQELHRPPGADRATTKCLAIGHLIMEVVVEGLASFLLVFWSCTAALMQEKHHALSFPMVCLVVALTVAFVLGWLGPAHLNPAVTITFAVFRYFPWSKLPLYVMVQLGGSVLACLSVNAIMKPREEDFYGTVPMALAGGHTSLPFLMEFLASAVLMIVIATVARGSASNAAGGVAIGAAVGTLGLVIGPISGGSMNPVRSLGPAIVLGRYTSIWIYIVAPVAGMLLGALCNKAVRQSDSIVAFLLSAIAGGRSAGASSNRVVVVVAASTTAPGSVVGGGGSK